MYNSYYNTPFDQNYTYHHLQGPPFRPISSPTTNYQNPNDPYFIHTSVGIPPIPPLQLPPIQNDYLANPTTPRLNAVDNVPRGYSTNPIDVDKRISPVNDNPTSLKHKLKYDAEEEDERTDIKKNKKREITKHSEQKRRDRLNERFEDLKALVPLEGESHSKRKTKESILQDTIQYIKELQQEIAIKKRKKTIVDPFIRFEVTPEEIDAGFNVLYTQESRQMIKINSLSKLQSSKESCYKLLELAEMSSRDEFKLYANAMAGLFFHFLVCDPQQSCLYMDKALPLYKKIQQQDNKVMLYIGSDIGCIILTWYAQALALQGYFDKANYYWNESLTLAKSKSHIPSERSTYTSLRYLTYAKGESLTIDEAEIIKKINPSPLGGFTVATGFIEQNMYKDKNEMKQLLDYVNENMSHAIANFGSIAEMTMIAIALQCYIKTDPKAGLQLVNSALRKIDETGVTGSWTKSDYLRLKGQLLVAIDNEEDTRELREQEALSLFHAALTMATESGLAVCSLRSHVAAAKLHKLRGEMDEVHKLVVGIRELSQKISMFSKLEPAKVVLEANEFLEKL